MRYGGQLAYRVASCALGTGPPVATARSNVHRAHETVAIVIIKSYRARDECHRAYARIACARGRGLAEYRCDGRALDRGHRAPKRVRRRARPCSGSGHRAGKVVYCARDRGQAVARRSVREESVRESVVTVRVKL